MAGPWGAAEGWGTASDVAAVLEPLGVCPLPKPPAALLAARRSASACAWTAAAAAAGAC